jgi:hypothetical protein
MSSGQSCPARVDQRVGRAPVLAHAKRYMPCCARHLWWALEDLNL